MFEVVEMEHSKNCLSWGRKHPSKKGNHNGRDDGDEDDNEDENDTMVADLYHQIVAELDNTIACGYQEYYEGTDGNGKQRDPSLPDFHNASHTHDEFVAFFDKCASSNELIDNPIFKRTRSMWRPWLERWLMLVREGVERLKQESLARRDLENAAETGVVWDKPTDRSLYTPERKVRRPFKDWLAELDAI